MAVNWAIRTRVNGPHKNQYICSRRNDKNMCAWLMVCHVYCQFYGHQTTSLKWRHNDRDGVSNHQPHDCLLNRLFRRKSKKTSKLRVTGLCEGNSPMTGEFPTQRTSNAENISIWWRHHNILRYIDERLREPRRRTRMIAISDLWKSGKPLLNDHIGTEAQ